MKLSPVQGMTSSYPELNSQPSIVMDMVPPKLIYMFEIIFKSFSENPHSLPAISAKQQTGYIMSTVFGTLHRINFRCAVCKIKMLHLWVILLGQLNSVSFFSLIILTSYKEAAAT